MGKYDIWWSSLKITEKERIASKVKGEKVYYPECTTVWNELDDEKQQIIHDHCNDSHGLILGVWKDGKPYGD